jgi:hypothetical protein
MPSSMLERTRALAVTLPRVAALNAPAIVDESSARAAAAEVTSH